MNINDIVTLCRDDFEPLKSILFISTPKTLRLYVLLRFQALTLLMNAEVVGISGDNEFCKLAWRQTTNYWKILITRAADCGLDLSD